MKNENSSEEYADHPVYHFIGMMCALTLIFMAAFLIPELLKGDVSRIHQFFRDYPGSQPFVIFISPVILIGGLAWIVRFFIHVKKAREMNRSSGKN